MGNCQVCGLPEEICMCKQQKIEGVKVDVWAEKRRYGKEVTVVKGVSGDKETLDTVAHELKKMCAAGGTIKEGKIEIQGSHVPKIRKKLQEMGYEVS